MCILIYLWRRLLENCRYCCQPVGLVSSMMGVGRLHHEMSASGVGGLLQQRPYCIPFISLFPVSLNWKSKNFNFNQARSPNQLPLWIMVLLRIKLTVLYKSPHQCRSRIEHLQKVLRTQVGNKKWMNLSARLVEYCAEHAAKKRDFVSADRRNLSFMKRNAETKIKNP